MTSTKSIFFGKVLSPSDLLNLGGPAGGSAPGKVLRPQGRIPHDSQSLSSSKSNTGAGAIQIKKACQKSWQIGPKNEDISKSVSSIDSGAIFPSRLGQDLSRNVLVVSLYALQKVVLTDRFFMTTNKLDFHEISSFHESCRQASWKVIEPMYDTQGCFRRL